LKVRVLVRPKEGILDPQGEAVRGALPVLGFEGVQTVHVGRLIEMELENADEVDAMCHRLLANPTIEEYEWEVVG
jgi:phosphoribosylformylglycinamidine synthase